MLELEGYSDLDLIGAGGFSLVYRARQARLNRLVAIKVLTVATVTADTERRFMRECQIAGAVSNHPNIVTLHDAGIAASGQPYMVFEYMSGGSLADRVNNRAHFSAEEVAVIGATTHSGRHPRRTDRSGSATATTRPTSLARRSDRSGRLPAAVGGWRVRPYGPGRRRG